MNSVVPCTDDRGVHVVHS